MRPLRLLRSRYIARLGYRLRSFNNERKGFSLLATTDALADEGYNVSSDNERESDTYERE